MKIISISEEIGLIWYVSKDYKHRDVHVIVYGLSVKQFTDRKLAQKEHEDCLNHHWDAYSQ